MGAVQLSDELLRMIERQVDEGRAASASAFLEEAALRLMDDAYSEEEDVRRAAEAGIADMEAGRYVTITTQEDGERLHERVIARLRR